MMRPMMNLLRPGEEGQKRQSIKISKSLWKEKKRKKTTVGLLEKP